MMNEGILMMMELGSMSCARCSVLGWRFWTVDSAGLEAGRCKLNNLTGPAARVTRSSKRQRYWRPSRGIWLSGGPVAQLARVRLARLGGITSVRCDRPGIGVELVGASDAWGSLALGQLLMVGAKNASPKQRRPTLW